MKKCSILLVILIAGSLQFPVEAVTDMVITDLEHNGVADYVFACRKIVSDPWNRGLITVYEDSTPKWHYHISSTINAIAAYDLDGDNVEEIICASDILLDGSYVYVFDDKGSLRWRRWVPGHAGLVYCYDHNVAVYLYGKGERIMIFNYKGDRLKDLPVNGDISKFEIKDINDDREYELIVSGIVTDKWEHFLVVYDLGGRVLWNYQTLEHINDFIFCDIDEDGIRETIIGGYDALYVTRGGYLLGRVGIPPPIRHVEIVGDQVLVVNRNTMFLINFYDILLLGGDTVPVKDFSQMVDSALRISVSPDFLFLRDIDSDDENEVLVGNGTVLETYELSDFGPPETVITVPAVTAELPTTFSTYENADYGFKIGYPRTWTVTETVIEGIPAVQFISPLEGPDDVGQENVTVAYEDLPQPTTLEEYAEATIGGLGDTIEEFNLIESVDTTLSGNPARKIVFTGKYEGMAAKWMEVLTIKGNRAYTISYIALPTTYARFLGIVQEMMDSFEILERAYALRICDGQYDPPGEDRENLNGEWVKICNDGDKDIDLSGWSLMNRAGLYYDFPDGFILKGKSFVIVYSGAGRNTANALYWGSSVEIWNNKGDTVILMDSEGETVLEYEWVPA